MARSAFGPAQAADSLDRLRERRPRVHCITNSVAEAFTANVLLAAGAVPSMTTDPAEVPHFVGGADALLVNLGTLDECRRAAIDAALDRVDRDGRPWALDPVFVDRSPPRLELALKLVSRRPHVVRANRAETGALFEAGAEDEAVLSRAKSLGLTLAVTGDTDLVTDGERVVRIANGHAFMSLITAAGCAATALLAGFLAVERDPLAAAVACLAVVGIAGELAGGAARGPGSFVPAFLDRLHSVEPEDILNHARIA